MAEEHRRLCFATQRKNHQLADARALLQGSISQCALLAVVQRRSTFLGVAQATSQPAVVTKTCAWLSACLAGYICDVFGYSAFGTWIPAWLPCSGHRHNLASGSLAITLSRYDN